MIRIVHQGNNNVIASKVIKAASLWSRTKGLLGEKSLEPGSAMWIVPCKSIHTFFMQFPIDAIFISRSGKIVGLCKNLAPFRLSSIYWDASSVIELRAGTIETSDCKLGDIVEIKETAD